MCSNYTISVSQVQFQMVCLVFAFTVALIQDRATSNKNIFCTIYKNKD